ncbi:hypothetical protein B0A48_01513 [Cryoendolithus antarcticus]|uniref:Uncharacterized protein n=1 Tax=Cryoendolithus antarcticus TaxID=1507870 RepID=A0A1V8TPL4_9PEZI|nr:hypothetical protein B0A48_01513 [Cryoendolithus antarcticus]
MPGFTPINVPIAAQPATVADNETAAARSLSSNTRQITQDVIITQAEQQTLDSTAQKSKKPRKTPGRGKKRPRKDSHDAPQKRCKSGSVAESMTVTKPGVSSTKAASDAVTGKRRSSTYRAETQSHCHEDLDDALDDALFDDFDQAPRVVQHETRPVSLYAHPTTMSSGNAYQTRTTMQQVSGAPLDDTGVAIVLSEDDFSDFEEPAIRSIYAMETIRPASPPLRDRALNKRNVDENESYGGALFSQSERDLLDSLKSTTNDHVPVMRTPFPTPILDRSPLFGVTNAVTLRTCFRVGEAVNAGCQAVRMNKNVILELYARVTRSHRGPKPARKQVFEIHDLYHDHPPHLQGSFDLWDQSTLWELDSRPFLTAGPEGMLARMIARMKRDGMKWRLEILSIWQADWDDVEHVAGIYAKSDGIPGLDD